MRISVWKTGHHIADTVADALMEGFDAECFDTRFDRDSNIRWDNATQIAYGILRDTNIIFNRAESWLNVDRGYFHPRHFNGYYRISHRGTQQTDLSKVKPDYDRLEQLKLELKPWRGFDHSKPVLVIPPSEHVCRFFDLRHPTNGKYEWTAYNRFHKKPYPIIRYKSDPTPINFDDYNYVLTFNSSVGWQAIQAGIPCVSDTTRSIVGSYYHNISLDELSEKQYETRQELFAIMSGLQFTLSEIRAGLAWKLVKSLAFT